MPRLCAATDGPLTRHVRQTHWTRRLYNGDDGAEKWRCWTLCRKTPHLHLAHDCAIWRSKHRDGHHMTLVRQGKPAGQREAKTNNRSAPTQGCPFAKTCHPQNPDFFFAFLKQTGEIHHTAGIKNLWCGEALLTTPGSGATKLAAGWHLSVGVTSTKTRYSARAPPELSGTSLVFSRIFRTSVSWYQMVPRLIAHWWSRTSVTSLCNCCNTCSRMTLPKTRIFLSSCDSMSFSYESHYVCFLTRWAVHFAKRPSWSS